MDRCAKVLHDVGYIVHFHEEDSGLKDIVFLEMKYLTNIFATIITTKANYTKNGTIEHKNLKVTNNIIRLGLHLLPFLLTAHLAI